MKHSAAAWKFNIDEILIYMENKMRKFLVVFIPLFILFTLAITNPSKAEYVEWADKQIMGSGSSVINKVGSAIVSPIIKETTTYNNYLLFSTYKTTNLDGSVYKTLGIYRGFILLSKTEGYLNFNNSTGNSGANIDTLIKDAGTKVNEFINNASQVINDNLTSQASQPTTNDEEFDICGTITEGPVYNTYINGRYGFSVDYPNNFEIGTPPANGDGLHFTSKDGKATLTAYGSNNVMDETAKSLYNQEVAGIKEISYQFFKDNWFVLSWIDNGTVYYTRTMVGPGSINSFEFTCPKDQLDQYYDAIEHISKSFKKGNIEEAN